MKDKKMDSKAQSGSSNNAGLKEPKIPMGGSLNNPIGKMGNGKMNKKC